MLEPVRKMPLMNMAGSLAQRFTVWAPLEVVLSVMAECRITERIDSMLPHSEGRLSRAVLNSEQHGTAVPIL
jgi:hypothetical protein